MVFRLGSPGVAVDLGTEPRAPVDEGKESLRTPLSPPSRHYRIRPSEFAPSMDSEPPQGDSIASQATPEEQIEHATGDSAKRKAEQPNGTQTRSKRNRYISIAWYAAHSSPHRLPPCCIG